MIARMFCEYQSSSSRCILNWEVKKLMFSSQLGTWFVVLRLKCIQRLPGEREGGGGGAAAAAAAAAAATVAAAASARGDRDREREKYTSSHSLF